MGKIKRLANRILPRRLTRTVSFYKLYNKDKKELIHQFLDEETVVQLENYPRSKSGTARLLGKEVKFSNPLAFTHSVEEIFCGNIYDFKVSNQKPYILDCGANIGLSVIFFKKLYPQARIVAFEPDKEIFQVMQDNVKAFGLQDVTLVNKAVWDKTEQLSFFNEGSLAGSLVTDFNTNNNVTVVEAEDLLPYLSEPVDFLKIDIEGAELVVMQRIAPKLSMVQHLFLEYHSDRDKPQQLQDLLALVSEAGFRYYIKEADNLTFNAFVKKPKGPYDVQLNIFCYR